MALTKLPPLSRWSKASDPDYENRLLYWIETDVGEYQLKPRRTIKGNKAVYSAWRGNVFISNHATAAQAAKAAAEHFKFYWSTKANPRGHLSVPEKHQLKIARDTLRMSDAMVGVMGGPTKAQARKIINELTGKRSFPPQRNGRSYVVRGETPKRYWEPSQGDVVYIEGTKTRLGKPYADPDTGKLMFPLRPSVRGTTDMGAGNIKAIARVEEGKGLESVGSTATFSRRPNPEPITPVIFRKFPASEGGEVIALFPYDREDYGRMSSYMHTGQHSAASHMLVYKTKLATPAEYADLKRELEGIGYRLKVIKKGPSYRALARAAALSKEGNPRTRKTRDVWVVQGNYGYGDGWEDVTAEETYREARQRLKEYRENEPQYPHRLKLTREKIETSVSNPAALPTKWTSATVSRKGRQIQIRIGRGR